MSTGNLLLVEDDRGVRESLCRALELEGFDVCAASDGLVALDMLIAHTPDTIILDVMMPRLDGLEVARRVRAREDTTPILMLTARHEVSSRVDGLDAGADDYLVKPFALDELLARIRALLRRSGLSGQGNRLRSGGPVARPGCPPGLQAKSGDHPDQDRVRPAGTTAVQRPDRALAGA